MIKTAIIILYVIEEAFDGFIDFLNSSYLKRDLPENVKDVYDEEEYKKYLEYEKANGKIDLIDKISDIVIQLCLLGFNVYAWLFDKLSGFNLYIQYFIFIIIASVISFIVGLPFSYYETFVIEERFGMNKTTKKTFVLDTIKEFFMTIVVLCAFVGVLMYCIETFGLTGSIYFALIVIGIVLIIAALIIPLMRIFNKFTPLEDGELKDKLLELCAKYDVRVKKIVVRDASRRTTKSNAFCSGMKYKTISLDDNLVNNFSTEEIVAVFAHEFAHAKHKDSLKSLPFGIITSFTTISLLALVFKYESIFTAFGFAGINYYFAIYVYHIFLEPFNTILGLITNSMSRKREYRADAFAAKEGYGKELISALKKLFKESLSDVNPHPAVVLLYDSHPTLSQRITAIERNMPDL